MLTWMYPIEHGVVTTSPQGVPSAVDGGALDPSANRDCTTRLCSKFSTGQLANQVQGHLGRLLLAHPGAYTSITSDSADGVSHTVRIYEGYALPHAILRQGSAV